VKHELLTLLFKELPKFDLEDYTNFEEDFIPYVVNNQFNPKLDEFLDMEIDADTLLINSMSSKQDDLKDRISVYAYFVDKAYAKKILSANELMQGNLNCLMKPNEIPKCLVETDNNDPQFKLAPPAGKQEIQPAETKPDDKKAKVDDKKAKQTEAKEDKKKAGKAKAGDQGVSNAKEPPKQEEPKKEEPKKEESNQEEPDLKREINNSKVSADCQLEGKIKIERSIVSPGCIIKQGVKIVNSVIFRGTVLEQDCSVENSLVGWKCEIKAKAKVKNCFVGPTMTIEEGKTVQNETISKEEEEFMMS